VRTRLGIANLLACLACAGPSFQLPMTSAELAARPSAGALLAYLGQPDASAAACAPERSAGVRAAPDAAKLPALLVDGLRQARVAPGTWADCAEALLPALAPALAAELADRIVRAEDDLLAARDLERDPALQAQLAAAHRVTVGRPVGAPAPRALAEVVKALRPRLAAGKLGPVASRTAAELVEATDLDRGLWRGREVDEEVVSERGAAGEEPVLLRMAARLPDAALRLEAERQVVRLRVARSPLPEVRADAGAVEGRVLAQGVNPIALAEHPSRQALLDDVVLDRRVVVQQDLTPLPAGAVEPARTRLLGVAGSRVTPSVLPEVPLAGALHVELAGLSAPVTVCAPGRALDPTPCLAPADLRTASPLATIDAAGVLRLREAVTQSDAVALAGRGGRLSVPVQIGASVTIDLSWPVSFERPAPLVFQGARTGAPGPELAVRAERVEQGHLVYTVVTPAGTVRAAVEWADAPAVRVGSRGAAGTAGFSGLAGFAGSAGRDGWSATCGGGGASDGTDGGDGQDGGRGGDGGPGGAGGRVRVVVTAPAPLREETLALLRTVVVSQGGPGGQGGSGGAGGRGGAGGAGGSGASCTDADGNTSTMSGGLPGRAGRDGSAGADGAAGPDGAPGPVAFEVPPSS
jgi:hypothetical protein